MKATKIGPLSFLPQNPQPFFPLLPPKPMVPSYVSFTHCQQTSIY